MTETTSSSTRPAETPGAVFSANRDIFQCGAIPQGLDRPHTFVAVLNHSKAELRHPYDQGNCITTMLYPLMKRTILRRLNEKRQDLPHQEHAGHKTSVGREGI